MTRWTHEQVQALIARPRPKRISLKASPPPLERDEQANFFAWLRTVKHEDERLVDFAYAIPNGSYLHGDVSRRAIQGRELKRQGVQAGVPDVCIAIAIAPYHGLYVEFKRIDGPKPNADQVAWHERLRRRGYRVVIAYGFDEAKRATLTYLSLAP